jgi:hypothetical protein
MRSLAPKAAEAPASRVSSRAGRDCLWLRVAASDRERLLKRRGWFPSPYDPRRTALCCARARRPFGAVLTINVLSALPADAQVARDSVADQELRAAESQLSLALSSADVDQLSRLLADDFVSTLDDGPHRVPREMSSQRIFCLQRAPGYFKVPTCLGD